MSNFTELIDPGFHIGRYEVIAPLGQGVTANVYKVYDHTVESFRALKKLHTRRENPAGIKQFIHEASIGMSIHHPQIASTHDFMVDDEHGVSLVMDYVAGTTLQSYVEEPADGQFDLLNVGIQLTEILVGLRTANIIHRDIVPQNLIVNDGEVTLCDFGSACMDFESSQWRLPYLLARWLVEFAPDNPGFIGSRRAFPVVYKIGSRPTYGIDEYAASLVMNRLTSIQGAGGDIGAAPVAESTLIDYQPEIVPFDLLPPYR